MSTTTEIVAGIAEPIVLSQGLNLVDVDYNKEGSDWKLKVFIENKDGDLTLEHCEKVSKILSEELDRVDPITQSYILEVSSPGLERPLKKPEDYERFKGELIKVKTYGPIEGRKEFKGELILYENNIVKIKEKEGVIKIPFNKIADAHLVVDF